MQTVYLSYYFDNFEENANRILASTSISSIILLLYNDEPSLRITKFYFTKIYTLVMDVLEKNEDPLSKYFYNYFSAFQLEFPHGEEKYVHDCEICLEKFYCRVCSCEKCKKILHRQCIIKSAKFECPFCRGKVLGLDDLDIEITNLISRNRKITQENEERMELIQQETFSSFMNQFISDFSREFEGAENLTFFSMST